MQGTVLIVDDQPDLAKFLARRVKKDGFEVEIALDVASAKVISARICPDVVLLDLNLPDGNGMELMREMRKTYNNTQFIIITAYGSIRSAIESTRLGAFEYLTKPFDPDDVIVALRNAMKIHVLKEEMRRLRLKKGLPGGLDKMFDQYTSPAMQRVLDEAICAAESDANLTLTGESGTGKNHLAGLIHKHSKRADSPFFDINCASIPPSLVESELFGHEPGAFTSSQGRKRGLLELADGGTLFLDEIGDMPPTLQSKLLSFLDSHTIRRVGGEKIIKVNARIIVATNKNLEQLVNEKQFREDLYYRLNVLSIYLPPLRERLEDIPVLAAELLTLLASDMGLKSAPVLTAEALQNLEKHDWPGNVRELKNVLERALLKSSDKSIISDIILPDQGMNQSTNSIDGVWPGANPALRRDSKIVQSGPSYQVHFPNEGFSFTEAMANLSRQIIEEALSRAKTITEAAAVLGITRFSLTRYIKKLGIDVRK